MWRSTTKTNILNLLQSTIAAAERVFELLDETEQSPEREGLVKLKAAEGAVRFEHVRFGYSEDSILITDMNVEIKPGQKVGICGPTGAGKTTLVNLLMRFYDLNGGKIFVDGIDTLDMSRQSLRRQFGMVLQDTWLYEDTIRNNIRYGRPEASDEEVEAACKMANADFFIATLPEGYETVVDESASNLSAGQKQLLTIARAFCAEPQIVILDEATSSVDTRTEKLIAEAMGRLTEGKTNFQIAHRLSTIRDADIILVLKDGGLSCQTGGGSRRSSSVMGRMTRQGLPAAKTPAGMSLVTTLPAPMTLFAPMDTPARRTLLPPTQTPSSTVTGAERQRLSTRSARSIEWLTV